MLSRSAIYLVDVVKIMGVWVIWLDELEKFKLTNYVMIFIYTKYWVFISFGPPIVASFAWPQCGPGIYKKSHVHET